MKINTTMFIKVTLLMLLLGDKAIGQEVEPSQIKELPRDMVVAQLLPVNVSSSLAASRTRVNLAVEIPADFVAVSPVIRSADESVSEFIPKTDKDLHSWTEIITVSKLIGRGLNASYMTEQQKYFLSRQGSPKILEHRNRTHETHIESFLLIRYFNKGNHIIAGMKFCSGPYDCSGCQYTIVLNEDTSEEKAREKIENFLKNNTEIIQF